MLNHVTGLEQRLKLESTIKKLSPNFDVGTEQIKDAEI